MKLKVPYDTEKLLTEIFTLWFCLQLFSDKLQGLIGIIRLTKKETKSIQCKFLHKLVEDIEKSQLKGTLWHCKAVD